MATVSGLRSRWRTVALAVVLLVACADSSPANVEIDSALGDVEIVADWEAGTFSASADGDLCPGGEHSEKSFADDGERVDYELVCADGSGTLVLRAAFEPLTAAQEGGEEGIDRFVGTWSVAEGTGDYASTDGSGTLVVEFANGALATYQGGMSP